MLHELVEYGKRTGEYILAGPKLARCGVLHPTVRDQSALNLEQHSMTQHHVGLGGDLEVRHHPAGRRRSGSGGRSGHRRGLRSGLLDLYVGGKLETLDRIGDFVPDALQRRVSSAGMSRACLLDWSSPVPMRPSPATTSARASRVRAVAERRA